MKNYLEFITEEKIVIPRWLEFYQPDNFDPDVWMDLKPSDIKKLKGKDSLYLYAVGINEDELFDFFKSSTFYTPKELNNHWLLKNDDYFYVVIDVPQSTKNFEILNIPFNTIINTKNKKYEKYSF